MPIFKCKMCGGTIEFETGSSIGTCDYCGRKQTLPRIDDERRINLYDRADHFRRNNEFDKALGIYEQILSEDISDAEAYWSIVLCRYGIEYVEDPVSHKRIPTINRTQYTSIFDDEDYRSAMKYADEAQKSIYEQDANEINEIQKEILAISQKEDPFDVFICYKETDQDGRRTQDSVLGNDIYHALSQEGFRVFFSRITLEDKIGTAYEPYIFAALNSARVMVVLGTRGDYFNSAWVKNEWSRYLTLVKESKGKKVLIPAYRDMDPYDLPEEFSHLQALDMSKLGFMQDLIRGIKKISSVEISNTNYSHGSKSEGAESAEPLVKRAFLFLEDGDFKAAEEYCERALDKDPENARAYLGKLMVELKVCQQEELSNCKQPFDENNYYKKAIRFGDDELKSILKKYIADINERNENTRLDKIYEAAVKKMKTAQNETEYKDTADIFAEIRGWKDSDDLVKICYSRIEEIKAQKEAERQEKKRQSEIRAAKRKKTISIVVPALVVCGLLTLIFIYVIIPKIKLNKAISLLDSGEYESAYTLLEDIGDKEAIVENKCERVVSMLDSGDVEGAKNLLEEIRKYNTEDNAILKEKQQEIRYLTATKLAEKNMIKDAYSLFSELGTYKDSEDKAKELNNALVKAKIDDLLEEKDYEKALKTVEKWETEDLALKQEIYDSTAYLQGQYYIKENNMEKAYEAFLLCINYRDSMQFIKEYCYDMAVSYMKQGELLKALDSIEYIDDTYENKQHMKEMCEEYKDISGIWKCTNGDVEHSEMFIIESMYYTDIFVCVSIDVNTDEVHYYIEPTESTWFEKREYIRNENKLCHNDEYTAFVDERKEGLGGEVISGLPYEADVSEDYLFDLDSGRLTIRDKRKDTNGKGFADEIVITATFNRPE